MTTPPTVPPAVLDVEAVRARAAAATAGPWEPYFTVHGDPYVAQTGRAMFGMVVSTAPEDYGRADCTFIAHARTDVPQLCDEVDRLRAALRHIGRCCGNPNFVANEALGLGPVAHPDDARALPDGTDG